MEILKNDNVKILYINWKGEMKWRNIKPIEIVFTSTKWHKEEQWILRAIDLDKDEQRFFAMKDIQKWRTEKQLEKEREDDSR